MADPISIAALAGISGGNSLMSFAGNLLGSTLSFRRQKQLMEHQAALNYNYGHLTAENSPTWNRTGLEKAGYNPMLAVQNATSGVNSNFAAQSAANEPDFGSSLGNALSNATDVARLQNESKATESTVDMNKATARRQNAEASNLEAENPFISKRQEAEIGKIGAETTKLGAETDHFTAMIENMKARLALEQYLGEMGIATQRRGQDISYNASKYASDVAKYGYDSKFASDIYGINVSHPFAKDYVGTLFSDKEVSDALYNAIKRNSYRNRKYIWK